MTIKQLFGTQKTYFIRCQNFVKIGIARDPEARRDNMQTGNPFLLTVVHVIEGNCEADLHRKFFKHRVRGEWFWNEGELRDWLDARVLSIKDTYRDVNL